MDKSKEYAGKLRRWPLTLCAMLALTSCAEQDQSVQGFVPPEGDIAAGQLSFTNYGCNNCHVVAGTEIAYLGDDKIPRIQLGGKVRKVKSFGDLLTSIVNPNHSLVTQYLKSLPNQERKTASSPMPDFNKQLTVADMIDLAEFLHSRYEETVPEYTGRRYVR